MDDEQKVVTLSWKTGGLLGALMKAGLHAAPIVEDSLYTNKLIVDLGEMFGKVKITVELEEEDA